VSKNVVSVNKTGDEAGGKRRGDVLGERPNVLKKSLDKGGALEPEKERSSDAKRHWKKWSGQEEVNNRRRNTELLEKARGSTGGSGGREGCFFEGEVYG